MGLPQFFLDRWNDLTKLSPGVQGAILIVLAALTLLVVPGIRALVVAVITWPFKFVVAILSAATQPKQPEGDILQGFKPRLTFSVSAHHSGNKLKRGTAEWKEPFYKMPVYVTIKGNERSAYVVHVRFPRSASPMLFEPNDTAQLREQQVQFEGIHTVTKIVQAVPRLDRLPDLLGWVSVMPHFDKDGNQLTPTVLTIAYNVSIRQFRYPSDYLDKFEVELVRPD